MKNRTKIIVVVSVIVIVLLSIRNCSCNRQKAAPKPVVSKNNYLLINPPLPELDIPYQKFKIDPSKPNVLYSKYGAKINIPADAFLAKSGNLIKDKVVISFREFYNPLDFYLAGIPMGYNDNGVEKVLESGGMIELNATSNNNELFVNPENKIKVDLFSWTKSTDFNLYDLDKSTGNWIEKGKDSIRISNKNADLSSLPPIPPMPKVASVESFKIADDTQLFPEIEEYKNVRFEPIDISKCNISDAQEMSVKPLKNGVYEITSILKIGNLRKVNKCNCYLAFEAGKDYNDALKQYQMKYNELLKQRNLIKLPWTNYDDIVNMHRKNDVKQLDSKERIIRTLELNSFGFINCDLPTSYPFGGEINPMYVDENGKSISLSAVVLVEKNTNALFRYSATVKYNPKNDNILWGLTKDNKLAYLKNADFALLTITTDKQNVPMHVHEGALKTYDDIMKVLF
jgi:hypothetical protein